MSSELKLIGKELDHVLNQNWGKYVDIYFVGQEKPETVSLDSHVENHLNCTKGGHKVIIFIQHIRMIDPKNYSR